MIVRATFNQLPVGILPGQNIRYQLQHGLWYVDLAENIPWRNVTAYEIDTQRQVLCGYKTASMQEV